MTMLSISVPENISKILQSISLNSEIIQGDKSDHCTCFYFEDDGMEIETVLKIIPLVYKITQKIKPFIVNIKSYDSFSEGKYGFPIVSKINSKELIKLRNDIKDIFEENDIDFSKKFPKFVPHITLAYAKKECSGKFDEIAFPVQSISLYYNTDSKQKENLYVEFPFGKIIKNSSSFLDHFAGYFEKLAYNKNFFKA